MSKESNKKINNQNKKSILSPARTIARFIMGASLGTITLGLAFARGVIGTAVNGLLGVTGVVLTSGAFIGHILNFARVQGIKTLNRLIQKDKSKDPNADFTKKILNNVFEITSGRFKAASSTFSDIFSGRRDEIIKEKLSSLIKNDKLEEDEIPLVKKTNKVQKTTDIKTFISKVPNTREVIITSARLMLGMSKEERKEAELKTTKKSKKHSKIITH